MKNSLIYVSVNTFTGVRNQLTQNICIGLNHLEIATNFSFSGFIAIKIVAFVFLN